MDFRVLAREQDRITLACDQIPGCTIELRGENREAAATAITSFGTLTQLLIEATAIVEEERNILVSSDTLRLADGSPDLSTLGADTAEAVEPMNALLERADAALAAIKLPSAEPA
jgi:hypothetical protein